MWTQLYLHSRESAIFCFDEKIPFRRLNDRDCSIIFFFYFALEIIFVCLKFVIENDNVLRARTHLYT